MGVGATAVAVSSSYLFGDEANLTPPLPGYVTVSLSTSYQLTDHIQLFAWAANITNARTTRSGIVFLPTSSVLRAGARGDQSAQLQPGRACWRFWRCAYFLSNHHPRIACN